MSSSRPRFCSCGATRCGPRGPEARGARTLSCALRHTARWGPWGGSGEDTGEGGSASSLGGDSGGGQCVTAVGGHRCGVRAPWRSTAPGRRGPQYAGTAATRGQDADFGTACGHGRSMRARAQPACPDPRPRWGARPPPPARRAAHTLPSEAARPESSSCALRTGRTPASAPAGGTCETVGPCRPARPRAGRCRRRSRLRRYTGARPLEAVAPFTGGDGGDGAA